MNDAERDAWLREALRHAPDSGALPPRALSEAILASARAAARSPQGLPLHRASRAPPTRRLAAFWDWLVRPPVAAGFASVLVATLVGLMWWDRPMDDMLARRPPAAREEAAPATPGAVVRSAETPPANTGAPADVLEPRRQQRPMAAEQPAADEAKVAPSKNAVEAPEPAVDGTMEAPRQQSEAKKQEMPTAFPRADLQQAAPAAQAAPGAVKKDAEPSEPDARREAASRNAAESPSDALASGRLESDAQRAAAASNSEPEKAKLAAAQPAFRKRAADEARAKEASAFASSDAAAERNAVAAAPRDGAAAAAPLPSVLAAIAAAPAQWSRESANGAVVALDAGWRDWLLQLDAAAAGRWRAGAAGNTAPVGEARDAAATVRLIGRDRSAVVVRLEGSTASIERAPGERWQASLAPEAAERLRASAERLTR